jgi:hypothetical protein
MKSSIGGRTTFFICIFVLFFSVASAAISLSIGKEEKDKRTKQSIQNREEAKKIKEELKKVIVKNNSFIFEENGLNQNLEKEVNMNHVTKKILPDKYSLKLFSDFDKKATGTLILFDNNFDKSFCVDYNKTTKINFKAISAISASNVVRPSYNTWYLDEDSFNYLFLNNLKPDETFCMQDKGGKFVIAGVFEPKWNDRNVDLSKYMQILALNIAKKSETLNP